jgi:KTSC domain
MSKTYTVPQAFSENTRPDIELHPVESNQVKAIGHHEDSQTLAVTFTRGAGAIYHYPNVTKETYEAFKGAESIGKFFGENIKSLAFEKYPAPETEDQAA